MAPWLRKLYLNTTMLVYESEKILEFDSQPHFPAYLRQSFKCVYERDGKRKLFMPERGGGSKPFHRVGILHVSFVAKSVLPLWGKVIYVCFFYCYRYYWIVFQRWQCEYKLDNRHSIVWLLMINVILSCQRWEAINSYFIKCDKYTWR